LIQPLERPLSSCTQSPSRFVTFKRVPLGAVPRTGPFVEGVDLMFTPGRCKKTISRFCDTETVWCGVAFAAGASGAASGEVSTVMEGGRSGQATAASGSREGKPSEPEPRVRIARLEACTAGGDSADCATGFSPAGAQRYARVIMTNAATIVVPTISSMSFRRDPKLVSVSAKQFSSRGWKECSSLVAGPRVSGRHSHGLRRRWGGELVCLSLWRRTDGR
jgi:hypothetical protein